MHAVDIVLFISNVKKGENKFYIFLSPTHPPPYPLLFKIYKKEKPFRVRARYLDLNRRAEIILNDYTP